MPEQEDVQGEGFQIVGHETQKTEEPQVEEPPAGEPEVEAPAEETPPGVGELPRIDVYAVLHVSIAQLAAVAWQKMGLQADPFTNQIEKDIEQARLAIDAAAGLIEKLQPKLEKQQARDYQNLLTDLRLNFVRQSGDRE
jgi:hypothetical protein